MQSTLNPKPADDPHDFVVVPADHVRVAPAEDEISDLLRAAARHQAGSQTGPKPDAADGAAVPPVDTTFRATDVNSDVLKSRRSIGRRVMRAFAAVLLAACIGAAAMAWQASGYAFKKMALKWLPKVAVTTWLPLESLGLSSDPGSSAAEPAAAEAESPQPASPAQSAMESTDAKTAAGPGQPADSPQSIQSMARDLASVNQEVDALKASIAELKANQQQMARDLAKAGELNARAKLSSTQPRPAVTAARKPPPPYAPSPTAAAPAYRPAPSYPAAQAAAPPPVPQAAQPYPPRQVETLPPPASDTGLASVPRPPMPVQ
jgi:hypothetical protein